MRDETIGDFLVRLGGRVPAPGGGAVAALHAAQGAALVAMVGRYSTGERYAAHESEIGGIVDEADELRDTALTLAEEDSAAFTAVADAYRMPKSTAEEKAERSAVIAVALLGAAMPPAQVIGVAGRVVELAERLLPIGNPNVATDVAAAAESARAAATTARVNVEVNVGGVRDERARGELTAAVAAVDDLAARAERITAAVREGLAR